MSLTAEIGAPKTTFAHFVASTSAFEPIVSESSNINNVYILFIVLWFSLL